MVSEVTVYLSRENNDDTQVKVERIVFQPTNTGKEDDSASSSSSVKSQSQPNRHSTIISSDHVEENPNNGINKRGHHRIDEGNNGYGHNEQGKDKKARGAFTQIGKQAIQGYEEMTLPQHFINRSDAIRSVQNGENVIFLNNQGGINSNLQQGVSMHQSCHHSSVDPYYDPNHENHPHYFYDTGAIISAPQNRVVPYDNIRMETCGNHVTSYTDYRHFNSNEKDDPKRSSVEDIAANSLLLLSSSSKPCNVNENNNSDSNTQQSISEDDYKTTCTSTHLFDEDSTISSNLCIRCKCSSAASIQKAVAMYKSMRQTPVYQQYLDMISSVNYDPETQLNVFINQNDSKPMTTTLLPILPILDGYEKISDENLDAMLELTPTHRRHYPIQTKLNKFTRTQLKECVRNAEYRRPKKRHVEQVRRNERLQQQAKMIEEGTYQCTDSDIDENTSTLHADETDTKHQKVISPKASIDELQQNNCNDRCESCRRRFVIGGVLVDATSNRSQAYMEKMLTHKCFKVPNEYKMLENEHISAILEYSKEFGMTFPIPTRLNPVTVRSYLHKKS